MSTTVDWYAWHDGYDEIRSPLADRLAVVQDALAAAIDDLLGQRSQVGIISIAAGQSRDLVPVLINHPLGHRVRALVVDLDPRNSEFAEGALASAGLDGVRVRTADAGTVATFADAAPADIVLLGGLFDLLGPADCERTVAALPQLCTGGGYVICSADPSTPDRTPAFRAAGFDPAVGAADPGPGSVRVYRHRGPAQDLRPSTRLFALS